jgi:tetratricopeptide (TPR) repeat protein
MNIEKLFLHFPQWWKNEKEITGIKNYYQELLNKIKNKNIREKITRIIIFADKKELTQANKMIDDVVQDIYKMEQPEIDNIATAASQYHPLQSNILKRIGAYAMTGIYIITLGLIAQPTKLNAAEREMINQNGKNVWMTVYGNTGRTDKGETVVLPKGGQTAIVNGVVVPRYSDPTVTPYFQGNKKTKTQSGIDEQIRQQPTNASLYLQKGDELNRNKAPSQERIKVYQSALKYSAKMSDEDNAKIRYCLGVNYKEMKNIRMAIRMFEESLKYDPSNQNAKDWIKGLKKKL